MQSDRPATHWHGCYRLHLPCAVARIEQQTEQLLQVTAERDAATATAQQKSRELCASEEQRGRSDEERRRLRGQVAVLRAQVDELRRRLGDVGP